MTGATIPQSGDSGMECMTCGEYDTCTNGPLSFTTASVARPEPHSSCDPARDAAARNPFLAFDDIVVAKLTAGVLCGPERGEGRAGRLIGKPGGQVGSTVEHGPDDGTSVVLAVTTRAQAGPCPIKRPSAGA